MAQPEWKSHRLLWLIALIIVILAIAGGTYYYRYASGISSAPGNPPGGSYGPGMGQGPMFAVGQGQDQAREPGGLVAVASGGEPLPTPPVTDTATKLPNNVATQVVGNLIVTITLSPYPPVGFQQTNFDVTLTDNQGQAITDANISLDLTMPGMWMPPNTLETQHTNNGVYQATGRFTMRDLWRIEVIIERGNDKQSAFFDVWL